MARRTRRSDEMLYYECEGSVRGGCGRRHRTIGGARVCLRADQRRCRQEGGYSDRWIWRVYPGGARYQLDIRDVLL